MSSARLLPLLAAVLTPSSSLLWERTIHAWLTELGPSTGLSERHLHQDADLLEHNLANFHVRLLRLFVRFVGLILDLGGSA